MHVIDALHPVELLQRNGIEAPHVAHRGEGRVELGQGFHRGVGAHELVVVKDGDAIDVLDRYDGLCEAATRPRRGGTLLGPGGIGVDVVAAEALDGRDEIRADSLRDEVGVVGRLRIHRPRAAVAAHRHAAHRLHAAGEQHLIPAGAHLLRSDVDRLEPRGAVAVDLHPGNGVRQSCSDGGGLGDVGALVAQRGEAPGPDPDGAPASHRSARSRARPA